MKKLYVVMYNNKKEVGRLDMKNMLEVKSYKDKTIKELIQEMSEKDLSIKFKYDVE